MDMAKVSWFGAQDNLTSRKERMSTDFTSGKHVLAATGGFWKKKGQHKKTLSPVFYGSCHLQRTPSQWWDTPHTDDSDMVVLGLPFCVDTSTKHVTDHRQHMPTPRVANTAVCLETPIQYLATGSFDGVRLVWCALQNAWNSSETDLFLDKNFIPAKNVFSGGNILSLETPKLNTWNFHFRRKRIEWLEALSRNFDGLACVLSHIWEETLHWYSSICRAQGGRLEVRATSSDRAAVKCTSVDA